jgi:hypothetical protein
MEKTKIINIIFVVVLVANLVLFATKKIDPLIFWAIIILGAVFAYKVMPKLKAKK